MGGQLGPQDPGGGLVATEALHPAPPRHLIEQQRRCHRGIEAGGGAPQRNAHQLIAIAAGEHRKAIALRTGDDHQGPLQIGLFQADGALAGQAHNAVALLLEGVEGAVEIDNPGHRQVFQGSSRHLGHRAGEPGAAALGQHQTMGAQGLRTAHDGAKVVGIGETIHRHQQGGLAQGCTALNQGW